MYFENVSKYSKIKIRYNIYLLLCFRVFDKFWCDDGRKTKFFGIKLSRLLYRIKLYTSFASVFADQISYSSLRNLTRDFSFTESVPTFDLFLEAFK